MDTTGKRALPSTLPLSATLNDEELALYHEVLPSSMRAWDLRPSEYDALVANLAKTRTRRLSLKQHRRLSALMQIMFAITPRPLCFDESRAVVLRHPRTAPCGTRAAVDVMCASLEELESVAAYFQSLPHGPWLLPGVLNDFLVARAPHTRWYRELMEESEDVGASDRESEQDRSRARNLATALRTAALQAPHAIREALLQDARQSPCTAVARWGADPTVSEG